jgi:hypothetical protein
VAAGLPYRCNRRAFRPHGVFAGTLDNRTPIKACRGSWDFKLHA